MSMPKLELDAVSVVLLGSFNPPIFQPSWLAAHELVGQGEADAATIGLIRPEVLDVQVGSLKFVVTQDRFTCATDDPSHQEFLRDLVYGTFQILSHTPIHAIGMNRAMHFRFASVGQWHDFGHLLAPKTPWEGVLETPGLRSLTLEGKRIDEHDGVINVKVEPSARVEPGAYVHVNDHRRIADEHTPGTAATAAEIVRDHLAASYRNAYEYAEKLLNQVK